MQVTEDTTVQNILEKYPEAVEVFAKQDVDVPLECDESILDTALCICDSMCHIDDIDGLIKDLNTFISGR